MRIVHTCLRYPPALGGAETYIREIVERTRNIDEGRDVRVLTSKLAQHHPPAELAPEKLLDDPIYVQRLHHARTPWLSYPRLQALNYYIGHHQPDILHSYSFWYQPADIAARYARRHNIPFVFHPLYYENTVRRKPIWRLYKHTIGRKTFEQADAIVVISPYEQKLIEKDFWPARHRGASSGAGNKRFELIPPGIDVEKYRQTRPNPFASRGITSRVLLAAGRISAGKGLIELIEILPEIARRAPDIILAVAGEDFGEQGRLQRRAAALGVGNHIRWLGRLSDEELIGAYQHATLLVHPSHYEAFGIVLAEALAAGLPVVARRVAAIPFVVVDNKTGLLFDSKDQLLAHTLSLLSNDKMRKQLGRSGSAHAVQNFSWAKNVTQLLRLYQELGARK